MAVNIDYISSLIIETVPQAQIKSVDPYNKYFLSPADFTADLESLYYGDFNIGLGGSLYVLLDGNSQYFSSSKGRTILHPLVFDTIIPTNCQFVGYRIKLTRGIIQAYAVPGGFSDGFSSGFDI